MNKIIIIIIIVIALFFVLTKEPPTPVCPDNICETGENCPEDCKESDECNVQNLVKITEGVYPKWSSVKNLIAYTYWKENGETNIYTMNPDVSDIKCLTCNTKPAEISGVLRHTGQSYWHPNGNYLIFTAENENSKPTKYNLDKIPGIGHNNDIWIMTSDGSKYWRIVKSLPDWGVIRPSFSRDGTKIYWNEEYSCERTTCSKPDLNGGCCSYWSLADNAVGEEWGLWRMKYADIDFNSDGPVISNIHTVSPNELYPNLRFVEGSGFTPYNKLIWEASDISETYEGRMLWGNIYTSNLDGSNLIKISEDRTSALPYIGNENMEYSPDNTKIAWSRSNSIIPGANNEIYLMNNDGSDKTRLTYFNEDGHPHNEYGYASTCGELDWSPDGSKIILSFQTSSSKLPYSKFPPVNQYIYMLTFKGECG